MERWIINASPLILLGKIGRLDILEQLNPAYAIPLAVAEELDAGPERDPAKLWLAQSGSSRKILQAIVIPPHLMAWDLVAVRFTFEWGCN
jgi:predicted nucleic acid-binding protein